MVRSKNLRKVGLASPTHASSQLAGHSFGVKAELWALVLLGGPPARPARECGILQALIPASRFSPPHAPLRTGSSDSVIELESPGSTWVRGQKNVRSLFITNVELSYVTDDEQGPSTWPTQENRLWRSISFPCKSLFDIYTAPLVYHQLYYVL